MKHYIVHKRWDSLKGIYTDVTIYLENHEYDELIEYLKSLCEVWQGYNDNLEITLPFVKCESGYKRVIL